MPGSPDFTNLPWEESFDKWPAFSKKTVDLPCGISSHPVLFVNQAGILFALKRLPNDFGIREHQALQRAEALRLPAVKSFGVVELDQGGEVLITRYLDHSLPYRSLFMSPSLDRYRGHLIGAIANLLVQLHISGFFWGDCSLSNTLFRRDAGVLQAYLVDAESSEIHSAPLSPTYRQSDLAQMEQNIQEDLRELAESGNLDNSMSYYDTSSMISLRYQSLWNAILSIENMPSGSSYQTQERIRELNELGFSVRSVEFQPSDKGDKLQFKISVTDRSYHRDQLLALTGLYAEEMQARKMINEINELRAKLSLERGDYVSMEEAACHWMDYIYKPVMARLAPLAEKRLSQQDAVNPVLTADPAELYCQVLEHKWFLSEKAGHDVGHIATLDNYILEYG